MHRRTKRALFVFGIIFGMLSAIVVSVLCPISFIFTWGVLCGSLGMYAVMKGGDL